MFSPAHLTLVVQIGNPISFVEALDIASVAYLDTTIAGVLMRANERLKIVRRS
jgi:anti-anti-sigma regulatory factor